MIQRVQMKRRAKPLPPVQKKRSKCNNGEKVLGDSCQSSDVNENSSRSNCHKLDSFIAPEYTEKHNLTTDNCSISDKVKKETFSFVDINTSVSDDTSGHSCENSSNLIHHIRSVVTDSDVFGGNNLKDVPIAKIKNSDLAVDCISCNSIKVTKSCDFNGDVLNSSQDKIKTDSSLVSNCTINLKNIEYASLSISKSDTLDLNAFCATETPNGETSTCLGFLTEPENNIQISLSNDSSTKNDSASTIVKENSGIICATEKCRPLKKPDCGRTKNYKSLEQNNSLDKNKSSMKKTFHRTEPDLAVWRSKLYNEDGTINKKELTMRDFIYFNPPNNPMQFDLEEQCDKNENSNFTISDDDKDEMKDYVGPQIKLGSNGEIELDQDSLTVKPRGLAKKMKDLKKSKIIKEDKFSALLKNKKKRRKRKDDTMNSLLGVEETKPLKKAWTPEETLKFYKALNEYGSDFTTMMKEFPYRTRKQLKRKFSQEEKVRIEYVDMAMKESDSIDFVKLERELNKKKIEKQQKLKEKEKILEERKESKLHVEQEYEKLKRASKAKKFNCIGDPDVGICLRGKKYNEKVKRMRTYIHRMKAIYIEERDKDKKTIKKNLQKYKCKIEDFDSESDTDCYLFDIRLSFYQEKFRKTNCHEELFIQEIESEYDLDSFLDLSSEMYRNLGYKWKEWVKKKIVNQLLNFKEEDSGAKVAAKQMKEEMEEQERLRKLEESYKLFSDPFDYINPWDMDTVN